MIEYLDRFAEEGTEFETKALFTLYGVDVVASTGFGFEANAFTDPDSVFRDYIDRPTSSGKYVPKGLEKLKLLMFIFPTLAKIAGIKFFDDNTLNFFINIIKTTIEDRKKSGLVRNDFIDAMLQGFKSDEFNEINE